MRLLPLCALGVCAALSLPLAAQSVPTVRLSAPTASPREQFSEIAGAIELSGGRVLVADSREARLAIIDLASGAVRSIGRVGSGPGEFRALETILPRPGGAYVADYMLRRLLPINDDGTFGNAIAYPASIVIQETDARGRMYGEGSLPRNPSGAPVDSALILRWDPAVARIDTVMRYDAGRSTAIRRPDQPRPAFPGRDAWVPLPTGEIAVFKASNYSLTVWAQGRALRTTTIAWTPVRLTDAHKRAFEAALSSRAPVTLGGGNGPPPVTRPPATAAPDIEFPSMFPPFGGKGLGGRYATVASNGDVWVERLGPADASVRHYDVIGSRDGRLLGRVELPSRSRLISFGRGTVYVVERDADDISYLRRYSYPPM